MPQRLHAASALLPDGWAGEVAIDIGDDGDIAGVSVGVAAQPGDMVAIGPVVPAMPNLHSHAFQRAMAGLAEIAGPGEDSFWTWRELMYRTALLLTPDDVETIAQKLYLELLKGGFGAVAEFHYVHHDEAGLAYADRAELSGRVLAAAQAVGIGMTLLPVFYAHANFGGAAPSDGQRRFINDVDGFLALMQGAASAASQTGATLGYAFHSLRAATPEQMRTILAANPAPGPIHIHVAEQVREVEDCLAWSDQRPVKWLLDNLPVDERWCLIHATHVMPLELDAMARSGAVVGLCPATEASLGDGVFPGVDFAARHGRYGIGTDSHVATGVATELRTLEYGQRLRDKRRNRLVTGPGTSAGRTMFDAALAGGRQALGQPVGAIAIGYRASLVVLDGDNPFIGAASQDAVLDRWIFAVGDNAVRDVMVAGRWRIRDGRHADEARIDAAFRRVLLRLAGRG